MNNQEVNNIFNEMKMRVRQPEINNTPTFVEIVEGVLIMLNGLIILGFIVFGVIRKWINV